MAPREEGNSRMVNSSFNSSFTFFNKAEGFLTPTSIFGQNPKVYRVICHNSHSLMDRILVMLAGSFCHGTERTQAQTSSKNKSQQQVKLYTKCEGSRDPGNKGNRLVHTIQSNTLHTLIQCSFHAPVQSVTLSLHSHYTTLSDSGTGEETGTVPGNGGYSMNF